MKTRGLVILLLAFGPGCGSEAPPEEKTEHPAASIARGRIEGVVRFLRGEIPEATRVQNTTDPEVCGRGHTLEDVVVSSENRGIAHVIAAVNGVAEERIPESEPGRIVIDNTGCRFEPHAAVATVGSTLEAVNSDPILHTTHLYGAVKRNMSLPVEGAKVRQELDAAGLIAVKCDLHGWMQAFVRVGPHPYHAVTDGEGRFVIEEVPVGTHELELWHERLGTKQIEVVVEKDRTSEVSIGYGPDANDTP